MTNEIKTDYPFLSYNKESRTFSIDESDLHCSGCEPISTVYGWEIRIRNPKSGRSMTFIRSGPVKDAEGEILYDIYDGINGVTLLVFND